MKILVIPDSHLKISVIKNGVELAKKVNADKIILLGDYLDDWVCTDQDYINIIMYVKQLLRSNPNVEVLYGNHELSYMGFPCSGHNHNVEEQMGAALIPDRRFFFGVAHDNVIYTHAGITYSWLKYNHLITQNDLRLKLPKNTGAELLEKIVNGIPTFDVMAQVGPARGGHGFPSPLWADLTELISDPLPVKQVVGHTPVKQIENIGKCWFTDVYSNDNVSDEYLLVINGKPEVIHYGDYYDKR